MAPCKLEKFKSYIQLQLSEALNLSEQFILFLAFNLVTDWAQTIKGSVNRFVSRLSLRYWSRRFQRVLQVIDFHQTLVLTIVLLSRTICTTLVVSDSWITNLAHEWWVSIQSVVGIIRGGTVPTAVRYRDRLLRYLILGIHASRISISLSLLML